MSKAKLFSTITVNALISKKKKKKKNPNQPSIKKNEGIVEKKSIGWN